MSDTKNYCRYFNGLINNTCIAGIDYNSVTVSKKRPCFATGGKSCESYQPYSTTELELQERERQRFVNLISQNLSYCCEAPIDFSEVIQNGNHKGHGKRYCSKCRKVVFIV